jgi:pimeloyl-ACP methyl ester carboxylesterase
MTELAWEEHGSGQAMVCLHPIGADRSVMIAAMEPAVAAAGLGSRIRRIYPDLPGCGESAPVAPASEAVLAAITALAERERAGGPVLLAGWSYGGYLAAALARRQPDAVAGLLLICCGPRIMPADRQPPPGPPPAGPPGWLDGLPADLRDYFTRALGNRTAASTATVAGALGAARPCDEEYLQELRTSGWRLPDEDAAAAYPGPASVLAGRGDWILGVPDAFRLFTTLPGADFAVFAEAGHFLPLEQPARFGAAVADWLGRVSAGGQADPRP